MPITINDEKAIGSIISGVFENIPTGYLLCNGGLINRTAYTSLFSRMPSRTSTVTISNASPCVVTWTAHGLATGHTIQFSTTGSLPTGITAGTVYAIRKINANTFNLYGSGATAISNAMAGAYSGSTTGIINTSSAGSGTHTAVSYLYGNGDGSTTFGLPDMSGVLPRGAGVTANYIQSSTIILGEKTDDQFQGHHYRHGTNNTTYTIGWDGTGGTSYDMQHASGSSGIIYSLPVALQSDGTNGNPRSGNEVRPKSQAFNFYIKYC